MNGSSCIFNNHGLYTSDQLFITLCFVLQFFLNVSQTRIPTRKLIKPSENGAVSCLVSWCFEPSQPQRITSGLTKKLQSISKLLETAEALDISPGSASRPLTDKLCHSTVLARGTPHILTQEKQDIMVADTYFLLQICFRFF